MKNVNYRDIPEYPGYRVGSDGSVWSCRIRGARSCACSSRWRQICPARHEHGYHEVRLRSIDQKSRSFKVHRLVAAAFVPNPELKPEINHKNGDKTDNSASNLEWATRSENIFHAFRTGLKTSRHGEQCSWAKLTEPDVRLIRQIGNGQTRVSLARMFSVSPFAIYGILAGKTWRHVV